MTTTCCVERGSLFPRLTFRVALRECSARISPPPTSVPVLFSFLTSTANHGRVTIRPPTDCHLTVRIARPWISWLVSRPNFGFLLFDAISSTRAWPLMNDEFNLIKRLHAPLAPICFFFFLRNIRSRKTGNWLTSQLQVLHSFQFVLFSGREVWDSFFLTRPFALVTFP